MRFLGIGDYCDLSSLYLRLLAEGHDVKIHIGEDLCRDTLAGFVTHEFSLGEAPEAIVYAMRHPAEVMKAVIRLDEQGGQYDG